MRLQPQAPKTEADICKRLFLQRLIDNASMAQPYRRMIYNGTVDLRLPSKISCLLAPCCMKASGGLGQKT